jgi:hypothetical protein
MEKQKPVKVPVTRLRQMADSVRNEAFWDYKTAKDLYFKGKSAKNASEKQMYKNAEDKSNKLVDYNVAKAKRYDLAADKATAGRDTPLPSSDGIIGSITSKISELFK